jgi:hypothetical protein
LTVALATVAHDPRDVLLPKLRDALPRLNEVFDGIGVMASASASDDAIDVLRVNGVLVEQETEPDGTDTIGRRRRGCVRVALATGADHVAYADMDHAIRWLEREPDDLRATLAALPDADLTIIGRPPDVFAEAPAPLRETEGLCNQFYERLTGRPWELFIAVRGMSRGAAQLIVDECDEDTIATDVAWPLFVESRGLSLAYRESRLHYENHTWFASGISEREQIEADPRSWARRFYLAKQMMDAFARWGPATS